MAFEFDFYKTFVDAGQNLDRLQKSLTMYKPNTETEESVKEFIDKVSAENNLSRVQGPVPMYKTKEEAIKASLSKVPVQVYYFEQNIMKKIGLE